MHGAFGRLRDMTREWRMGVIAVKLDIKAAFDNISRGAVADYLSQHLEASFELRFLLRLLDDNVLQGCAPGGAGVSINSNRGIRQGSPESAELFGLIVAQIITELKSGARWRCPAGCLADSPADVGCYQDDIFVWGENPRWISHNIKLISEELHKIGLALAGNKTSVIASKYYKGVRYLDIAGERVEFLPVGSSLRVLGLDFDLDASANQQAKEIMSRVWNAFHSNKSLLCGVGSRKQKASMVCKLVDGCWSWCAGALHWETADLQSMNSIQLRILRLCFGIKRDPLEDWVSYNSRSLRDIREWLHRSGGERWSAKILRLQFQLMGHWTRRWEGGTQCLPIRMHGWRNLAWWQREQKISPNAGGVRHPRCFKASNIERNFATVFGVAWQSACFNRDGWKQLLQLWLQSLDVPWCRGRQQALCY